MHFRKLLLATGATVAAGALALAPAAQATTPHGPIASVAVGGSTTTADYGASLALKSGTSVTMEVYGSPTKLTCSSGSAAGTVHAGSPAPATFMNFSSLTLTCDSFIPGQTVTMSVPTNGCANVTMSDPEVHTGTVDSGAPGGKYTDVNGSFNLTGTCEVTVTAGSCTVKINGSTPVLFDEAKTTSPLTQDLKLTGNGLTVKSASFLCAGAVSVGDPLTLNNVAFNVTTNGGAGAIDFRS